MTLNTSRQGLLAALTAASIPSFYGMGAFSAPCARIFPADPWVDRSGLANGRRTQRWEVWVVAGKQDAIANFDELEALVSATEAALTGLAGWSTLVWQRPGIVDMGGTKYFACRGTIETTAEV